MILKAIFPVLLLILSFSSCTSEETPTRNQRTVLFYMATDNNLSGEATQKMKALLSEWNPADGELLFYIDRRDEAPQLYRATAQGEATSVATYPEEDSASPAVLGRVVREVAARYPADSYGLIFFSHASGWLPQGMLANARSIGNDQGAEMELNDFAAALPDGMFRFIVFEACLMGGVEVAYALRAKADYLLLSPAEIVSPGFTPIYGQGLKYLFQPQANLVEFGRCYANYCNKQVGYLGSMTLSVIETAPLHRLAQLMKESIALPVVDEQPAIQHFDRLRGYHLYFDLGQWVTAHAASPQAAAAIVQQIERCVVWKAYSYEYLYGSGGFSIAHYSGLTTYLPQRRFPVMNAAYKELDWYKEAFDDTNQ